MIADLRRRSGVDEGCFVALIPRSHGFTSGPAWFSALGLRQHVVAQEVAHRLRGGLLAVCAIAFDPQAPRLDRHRRAEA